MSSQAGARADEATVRKVAGVARIKLTEGEVKEFSKDLGSMLEAFKEIQKLDTRGVKPTFQPIETRNVTRTDEIEKGLSQEEALSNARQKEKGYFKGPRAI